MSSDFDFDSPIDSYYQLGGSLPTNAPSYVIRQADRKLYSALQASEYCYVLNSRQMGKSSLRTQTMQWLRAAGGACTEIELSGIGSQEITAQQWYNGIIQELISGFALPVDLGQWLGKLTHLSPVQSLGTFIESVLLAQIQQNIYIFIDEIDSVLSLNFSTDEFFALIRNCYDKRASHPAYRRLSFALIGVATPSELIQDDRSTPFNIGRAIELHGFKPEESAPLAAGLVGKVDDPQQAINSVLSWTGGQPFLTQKLCALLANNLHNIASQGKSIPTDISAWLAELVHSQIIDNWEEQDEPEHLRTVRDRLLRNSSTSQHLLKRCHTLLKRGSIPSRNSQAALELRLSGLVAQKDGKLVVKNRIYQSVFNQAWVEQQLDAISTLEPRTSLWKVLAIALLSAASVVGMRSLGTFQTQELAAFDHLMRTRPNEGMDDRLLLVTISESDVRSQPAEERGAASISDRSLEQLLQKLEQAEPSAIGLDIYRDSPVKPGYEALVSQLAKNDRLYAICQYGDPGVLPPSEVPPERQSLNNISLDAPDSVVRRQILAVEDPAPCGGYYSLNIALVGQYLLDEDIELFFTDDNRFQLGKTILNPLERNAGGYRNVDVSGYQVMLNYRAARQISPVISMSDILADNFDPNLIKDRIVLIGTVAPSFNDTHWLTPYTGSSVAEATMSGVEIQAHMASQLLSAVKDNRPLIWWWPETVEIIWIASWSAVGALLIWRISAPLPRVAAGGAIAILLYGSCWWLMLQGGWIPLFPAALSTALSGGGILLYNRLR